MYWKLPLSLVTQQHRWETPKEGNTGALIHKAGHGRDEKPDYKERKTDSHPILFLCRGWTTTTFSDSILPKGLRSPANTTTAEDDTSVFFTTILQLYSYVKLKHGGLYFSFFFFFAEFQFRRSKMLPYCLQQSI